uniref:NADH dehydrogenase subunit 3 n=1 Tax=Stictochironomus rosenschoeldi TaxID=2578633 RepID=UPI0023F08033|nr:NADH dehydrogenase subunit 3 [Stictochironomus rosenschoeldi]WEF49723.1 NADH dehydrogenase subunit 3 [Stictochironomus rosenschoeldi]
MLNLCFMSLIIFMIATIVMILSTFLSKKKNSDREKLSPFECGFNPFNSSRLPFSIRFFLIAIIFLIFDVEIALILPMIVSFKASNMMIWTSTNFIFIMVLIIGLYHEWNQGSLNWSF